MGLIITHAPMMTNPDWGTTADYRPTMRFLVGAIWQVLQVSNEIAAHCSRVQTK